MLSSVPFDPSRIRVHSQPGRSLHIYEGPYREELHQLARITEVYEWEFFDVGGISGFYAQVKEDILRCCLFDGGLESLMVYDAPPPSSVKFSLYPSSDWAVFPSSDYPTTLLVARMLQALRFDNTYVWKRLEERLSHHERLELRHTLSPGIITGGTQEGHAHTAF